MIGSTALLEHLAEAIVDVLGEQLTRRIVTGIREALAEQDARLSVEERCTWLTLKRVAELLDCSEDYAKRLLAEQGIRPSKFGSVARYPAAAVYAWLGPKEEETRKKDRAYPRGMVLFGGVADTQPRTKKRIRSASN